jgi:hypothetical protein
VDGVLSGSLMDRLTCNHEIMKHQSRDRHCRHTGTACTTGISGSLTQGCVLHLIQIFVEVLF